MLVPVRRGSRGGARWFAVALVVGAGLPACSFVVESQDRQCERDEDCAGFGDAVCDAGVCLPRESTGADACLGPDGCFACPPTTQIELLTACTDAACVPYDNGQLEGLLNPDGSVPPLP